MHHLDSDFDESSYRLSVFPRISAQFKKLTPARRKPKLHGSLYNKAPHYKLRFYSGYED